MNFDDRDRMQMQWEERARVAQAAAAQSLSRLLQLAESRDTGQSARIAGFLAATYNGHSYAFDLFELRAVDVEISDDMIVCIDALRWGKADLYKLIPEGARRIEAAITAWNLRPRWCNVDSPTATHPAQTPRS